MVDIKKENSSHESQLANDAIRIRTGYLKKLWIFLEMKDYKDCT